MAVSGSDGGIGQELDREARAAAFLSRLPSTVVRSGRVVNVRQDVADLIEAGGGNGNGGAARPARDRFMASGICIVETDVVRRISGEESGAGGGVDGGGVVVAAGDSRPATPMDVTTLQVKSQVLPTLIVKLRFDDTVASLRGYIDRQVCVCVCV